MRFCIVTPSVIKGDGQGRANYEIVWEAIRQGHQVTLLATNLASDLQQHSQVNWVNIPVKGYPTQLLKELVFAQRSAQWLRTHRQQFDIVQVYGAVTSAFGDINTVQFVHNAWLQSPSHTSRQRRGIYGLYHWLYTVLNAHWEKTAFQQAKLVIAVSEKIRQELIDIGVPPERTHVILNGVDVQEFFPDNREREALGLPEQVPLAIFVGDIRTNRKNLDTVLRALVEVPDLHLAVVGDTNRSPYPDMAVQLQLNDRVHFLGYRQDIVLLMQTADLFVFPSRYEACTLVLLEAMASGLPVITANSAGGAEIVTPECGVVLQDSDDVETLAKALRTLSQDARLRHQMGQAAYAIAQQHSWSSKAKSYVNLFEQVGQR
ncbi:glycosyltransferase family 4 protein [Phormidesmis sp. 146-35]